MKILGKYLTFLLFLVIMSILALVLRHQLVEKPVNRYDIIALNILNQKVTKNWDSPMSFADISEMSWCPSVQLQENCKFFDRTKEDTDKVRCDDRSCFTFTSKSTYFENSRYRNVISSIVNDPCEIIRDRDYLVHVRAFNANRSDEIVYGLMGCSKEMANFELTIIFKDDGNRTVQVKH